MRLRAWRKLSLLGALSADLSRDLPMTDILDIKPSIDLPKDPFLLPWILGGAGVLLLGSLLLGWFFRKRSHPSPEEDLREEARRRLKLLEEEREIPLRERYFELALVLRLALEGSLFPKAREKTLEELRLLLEDLPDTIPLKRDTHLLLRRLGEIQFGAAPSSEEEFSRHLLLVEQLVEHDFFQENVSEGEPSRETPERQF